MPIIPPRLDDRSYEDLVEELLARVPAHTPEWRPAEAGDPGRTLLELFAWLADTVLYRANLVPERQRLAFLQLLGLPLRPAEPARGLLGLSLDEAVPASAAVLSAGSSVAGPVPFETVAEAVVQPLVGECYCKRPLDEQEREALADTIDELRDFYGLQGEVASYVTTPVFHEGEARFDLVQDSVDASLWMALLAPPGVDPGVLRARLAGTDDDRRLLDIGLVPDAAGNDGMTQASVVRRALRWSISTPRLEQERPLYHRLSPVFDRSEALTRVGVVRLRLPADASEFGVLEGDARKESNAGVGERPPRLDDPERLARLVAWLRLRPEPGTASLVLRWAGLNAVEIDQRQSVVERVVGQSDGSADQCIELGLTAVDPGSLRLEVEEEGRGYVAWRAIDDLAQAGRDDAVFQLDAEAGTVCFGDGVRGRVPESGSRIKLAFARAGGGRAGNLPAGTLRAIDAKGPDGRRLGRPLKVFQPVATQGGADAETVAQAERRIPAHLRHRQRAVTADDYAALAFEVPGLHLGRVEVLPRFLPRQRREEVPGVVSVMVLPAKRGLQPPNPRPDQASVNAVHDYLAQRKPLTAELYVIGCDYVPLAMAVGIDVRAGFAPNQVAHEVEQAVRRYLWPLPPLGPAGQGWPLGREVAEGELEVVVARVSGVRSVNGITFFRRTAEGGPWRRLERPSPCEPVTLGLDPWQLPELLLVSVATDGSVATVMDEGEAAPSGESTPVAIPLVPEVC